MLKAWGWERAPCQHQASEAGRAQPGGAEPGCQLSKSPSPLQSFRQHPSLIPKSPRAFLRVEGRAPDRGMKIQVPGICTAHQGSGLSEDQAAAAIPKLAVWGINCSLWGSPVGHPREQVTEFLCSRPVCALPSGSVTGAQFF